MHVLYTLRKNMGEHYLIIGVRGWLGAGARDRERGLPLPAGPRRGLGNF